MATAGITSRFQNLFNGEWVESRRGKAYEKSQSRQYHELVGIFVSSNSEDVNAAVECGRGGLKSWRLVPAPKRAEILYRAAELLAATQRRILE